MTLTLLNDDQETVGRKQIICAKVGTIFGSKIEEITSSFVDGRPTGKSEIRSKDFVVDLLLDVDAIAHGMFRIRTLTDNGEIKLGRFKNGKVVGNCWIISSEKVTELTLTENYFFDLRCTYGKSTIFKILIFHFLLQNFRL